MEDNIRSRTSSIHSMFFSDHSGDVYIASYMTKVEVSNKERTKEISTTKKVWQNTVLIIRK